jgi:hypothetical protein
MNRYFLEVIKEGDANTLSIECDGYNVNINCYEFFDDYDVIKKIVSSYPIDRTIIYKIDYNIEIE